MDKLIKFCLPKDIQAWLNQYRAPEHESAFAKDIPNCGWHHKMADRLARYVQIRRKYRGKSRYGYTRPSSYCHKHGADRFALYNR